MSSKMLDMWTEFIDEVMVGDKNLAIVSIDVIYKNMGCDGIT